MNELRQLILRGKAAFDRGEYAAALDDFQEVTRQNAGFADVRHLSGTCLSFLGHPEAAIHEFNEAIALNPRYIEAHLNRAITLNDLGRFDEAHESFELASEIEEASEGPYPAAAAARLANGHANLGDLYMDAGAADRAAEQYRAALTIRPLFHDIRNKLAYALMQMGELEEAAAELQAILSVTPQFLTARLNLGLVFYRMNFTDAAAREWEVAHQQQPNSPQVRAYMALLEG